MFFLLLLFLAYTNMVYVAKLEDILPCTNDTDCSESIDSSVYTQSSKVNDSVLSDASNETEENNPHIMATSTHIITSLGNLNVTEQPDIQSTVTTISSPALNISLNNAVVFKLEKSEICECNLIVRIKIQFNMEWLTLE